MEKIIIIYLVFINIVSIILMKLDKRKAEKKQWRIQEKTLFFFAAIGGALGILLGMYTFRHKTKTWYFVVGIPLLLGCNAYIIFRFFPEVISILK